MDLAAGTAVETVAGAVETVAGAAAGAGVWYHEMPARLSIRREQSCCWNSFISNCNSEYGSIGLRLL